MSAMIAMNGTMNAMRWGCSQVTRLCVIVHLTNGLQTPIAANQIATIGGGNSAPTVKPATRLTMARVFERPSRVRMNVMRAATARLAASSAVFAEIAAATPRKSPAMIARRVVVGGVINIANVANQKIA